MWTDSGRNDGAKVLVIQLIEGQLIPVNLSLETFYWIYVVYWC
jgi:hypothetical protein